MGLYHEILLPAAVHAATVYGALEPEMAQLQRALHEQFQQVMGKTYSTKKFGCWSNLAVFVLSPKAGSDGRPTSLAMHMVQCIANQPSRAQPSPAQPSLAQPDPAQPSLAVSGPAQPCPTQPSPTQLSPALPSSA